MLDQIGERAGERRRVAEADEPARARGEHVARVPVGRRDDCTSGRKRKGERARRALLTVHVRRHEDVGGREQIGELVDCQEAIVELDVVAEAEVENAPLEHQPVLLALAPGDLRVGAAGDHVEHLGMARDDRGKRIEHHLDPLPGEKQPEGRDQEAGLDPRVAARGGRDVAGPAPGIELCAGTAELRRSAVRDDVDLLVCTRSDFDQEPPRRLGHHDHTLGLVAQRGQNLELMRRRRREHRVQGDDERLRELAGERQHVLAVAPAEDAVLVLEQDDVDIRAAERAGGADVVAARSLRDGLRDLGPLRARRLVDDHERADVIDAVDAEQCEPNVERERTNPAGTGWKRRKDRGTHECAPLSPDVRRLRRCRRLKSAGCQRSGCAWTALRLTAAEPRSTLWA